jgi:hypothetical protein
MVYVYVIEKNNSPIYVGKTINFSVRLFYHRKRWGSDINWFFIDSVQENEWKFWEEHYIALFKSWGYLLENKNNGGGGPSKYSEETRKKISDKKTGMKYNITDISRKEKSKKLTGRKFSKESKQKISDKKTGMKYNMTENGKLNKSQSTQKKVIQYSIEGNIINEYVSIAEASKKTNIKISSISSCCLGKTKISHDYVWGFENNNIQFPIYPQRKGKNILQYDLNNNLIREWENITIASNTLNLSISNISSCLRSKTKQAGGFIWKYK